MVFVRALSSELQRVVSVVVWLLTWLWCGGDWVDDCDASMLKPDGKAGWSAWVKRKKRQPVERVCIEIGSGVPSRGETSGLIRKPAPPDTEKQ